MKSRLILQHAPSIRFAMERTYLALILLGESHNKPSRYEIHRLYADKHGVSDRRRMYQEEE